MISNVPTLKGNPNDLKTLQKYLVTLKQDLEHSFMHIDITSIITNNTLGGKDASLNTLIDSLISLLDSEISRLIAYVNGESQSLQDYVNAKIAELVAYINDALANIESITELTERVEILETLVADLQAQIQALELQIQDIGQTSFKRYDTIPTFQQAIYDDIQIGEIILVKAVV